MNEAGIIVRSIRVIFSSLFSCLCVCVCVCVCVSRSFLDAPKNNSNNEKYQRAQQQWASRYDGADVDFFFGVAPSFVSFRVDSFRRIPF